MQASQNFPIDPNAKKNRVPGANEVTTLRNLAQRNERAMQDLDKQMEEGKAARLALQRRYEELLELVECTQSEIVATERSSATLAAQKTLIQADQEKVKALLHPIRRCPSDVLQYLFEWAVETALDQFRCATNISHVCRRWREVSILTPKLWVDIRVLSTHKWEDMKAFWSRTVERVKFAPARITIVITGTTDARYRVLRQCKLDQLQNIDHLEFLLHSPDAPSFFTSTLFCLPTCPVNHLELNSLFKNIVVNAAAISSQFESTRSLTLHYLPEVRFSTGLICPIVTTITIDNVDRISLSLLGRAFPNVETALLDEVTFVDSDTGDLIWPNLKHLTVSNVNDMHWELLDAKSIIYLSYVGVTGNVVAFITSHRSLETLEISDSDDQIHAITTSAPQIRKLTIFAFEGIVETITKLNNLTHLSICDYESIDSLVTLELFEELVQSHCLPSKYGKSSLSKVEPLSLTMLLDDSISKSDTEWHTSKLLATAHEEVTEVELWGSDFTAYCYKWE